jgi:hypothetical protein
MARKGSNPCHPLAQLVAVATLATQHPPQAHTARHRSSFATAVRTAFDPENPGSLDRNARGPEVLQHRFSMKVAQAHGFPFERGRLADVVAGTRPTLVLRATDLVALNPVREVGVTASAFVGTSQRVRPRTFQYRQPLGVGPTDVGGRRATGGSGTAALNQNSRCPHTAPRPLYASWGDVRSRRESPDGCSGSVPARRAGRGRREGA